MMKVDARNLGIPGKRIAITLEGSRAAAMANEGISQEIDRRILHNGLSRDSKVKDIKIETVSKIKKKTKTEMEGSSNWGYHKYNRYKMDKDNEEQERIEKSVEEAKKNYILNKNKLKYGVTTHCAFKTNNSIKPNEGRLQLQEVHCYFLSVLHFFTHLPHNVKIGTCVRVYSM
ncbi:hypothetical protein FQR65_LT03333 [Abscondita terminalis]|nr:hypothetical protein FQR65_LT03333 [Abscondita terminalis]